MPHARRPGDAHGNHLRFDCGHVSRETESSYARAAAGKRSEAESERGSSPCSLAIKTQLEFIVCSLYWRLQADLTVGVVDRLPDTPHRRRNAAAWCSSAARSAPAWSWPASCNTGRWSRAHLARRQSKVAAVASPPPCCVASEWWMDTDRLNWKQYTDRSRER